MLLYALGHRKQQCVYSRRRKRRENEQTKQYDENGVATFLFAAAFTVQCIYRRRNRHR